MVRWYVCTKGVWCRKGSLTYRCHFDSSNFKKSFCSYDSAILKKKNLHNLWHNIICLPIFRNIFALVSFPAWARSPFWQELSNSFGVRAIYVYLTKKKQTVSNSASTLLLSMTLSVACSRPLSRLLFQIFHFFFVSVQDCVILFTLLDDDGRATRQTGRYFKKINMFFQQNIICSDYVLPKRISENERSKYIAWRTHQKCSVGGAPQVHTPDSISEDKMVENFKEVLTS